MRKNIIYSGGNELTYEIRSIVKIGTKLKDKFDEIIWENIGDPIAKGHSMADWMKEIVSGLTKEDESYVDNSLYNEL